MGKLVRYYLRYCWVIVLAALLGAGVGLFYSQNILKPEYRSDSTVILNQHQSSSDSTLINNYTALLKSRKVLEPIIDKAAQGMSYNELHESIEIVNEKATEIITISVTAPSAELAQNINQGLIESFNLESLGLIDEAAEKKPDNQIITVIDEAAYNPAPVNVKASQNVMVLAAGMAAVSMVAMFVMFDYKNNPARLRGVAAPSYARRRSKMIGAIVAPATPQIDVHEISKDEQRVREVQNNQIKLIKREATDILDVLQNIGGIEVRH